MNERQRDSYLKLIRNLPLVSIKTERHHDVATAMIDRLTDKKKLDGGEEAYLDALCDLVAVYEDQHHALPEASDADLLRHLMEAKQVSQSQLHKETGLAKSGVSEVLSGKKPFSKRMIGVLSAYFNVPPSVLVRNVGTWADAQSSKAARR